MEKGGKGGRVHPLLAWIKGDNGLSKKRGRETFENRKRGGDSVNYPVRFAGPDLYALWEKKK